MHTVAQQKFSAVGLPYWAYPISGSLLAVLTAHETGFL